MRNPSVLSPTRGLSGGLPWSAVTGQGRTILREGWSAGSGADSAGTTPHICAHVWDGSPAQAPLVLQKRKFSGDKEGSPTAGLHARTAHLLGQLMRAGGGATAPNMDRRKSGRGKTGTFLEPALADGPSGVRAEVELELAGPCLRVRTSDCLWSTRTPPDARDG